MLLPLYPGLGVHVQRCMVFRLAGMYYLAHLTVCLDEKLIELAVDEWDCLLEVPKKVRSEY